MTISKDHIGGNIAVRSIQGDRVYVAAELRDTNDDWFYWNFCICGAQGRTVTFDFGFKAWVGYFGPAVSHDTVTWAWGGTVSEDRTSFTYTFGFEEDQVYFCHDLYYSPARFAQLAEELHLPVQTLCLSEKGLPVPLVETGEGEEVLFIASRHHSCESTGTYVLEGILRELTLHPIKGLRVIAVPFADLDGVMYGDQGKNRLPHDHNRDYTDAPIYRSVAAIQALATTNNVVYAFDLHSPWHTGGRNDVCFEVRKNPILGSAQAIFGELFEAQTSGDPRSLQYHTADDLLINTEWNQEETMVTSCGGYFAHRPGMRCGFSLETPYFGTPENRVTQEKLVVMGRCFGRAIAAFRAQEEVNR